METSVIIITKNQKNILQKSIPVLKKQNSKDYEIIVVDSGSTDGAKKYCLKEGIKLINIPPDNFKFARAFNTGARKAKGKYIIRLSGDSIPQNNDFISEIIKPFKDPKVGGTFGKYVISGRKGYTYPNFWPSWRFPQKLTRYSIKPVPFMGVGFLIFSFKPKSYEFAGGCCAIRKSIWQKRPFNESLIAGEDSEYSWFLHLIGYDVVYNPMAIVLHEHKVNPSENYINLIFSKWNNKEEK